MIQNYVIIFVTRLKRFDIQLTLVQTVPITGAVIVTTPQEVAVVDAVKAMNMFLLESNLL